MLFLYDFEPLLQKGNATFQDEFDITVITPYCWDFKKTFYWFILWVTQWPVLFAVNMQEKHS